MRRWYLIALAISASAQEAENKVERYLRKNNSKMESNNTSSSMGLRSSLSFTQDSDVLLVDYVYTYGAPR